MQMSYYEAKKGSKEEEDYLELRAQLVDVYEQGKFDLRTLTAVLGGLLVDAYIINGSTAKDAASFVKELADRISEKARLRSN